MKSKAIQTRVGLKQRSLIESYIDECLYFEHLNMEEINEAPDYYRARGKIKIFVDQFKNETGLNLNDLEHEEFINHLAKYLNGLPVNTSFDFDHGDILMRLIQWEIVTPAMIKEDENPMINDVDDLINGFCLLIAEMMQHLLKSSDNNDPAHNRYKSTCTIKEYKTKFYGWDLVIPKGSRVGNKTASGCDDNYHFWMDYRAVVVDVVGFLDSGLMHDLAYHGVNIPAEYCNPYI